MKKYSSIILLISFMFAGLFDTLKSEPEDGPFVEYYISGQLKSKGNFLDGVQNGHWQFYYVNEILQSEGNYINGVQDGNWFHYYDNGKIQQKEFYKLGYPVEIVSYFKNGNIKEESFLKHDIEDILNLKNDTEGVIKKYYENGNIEYEENYINGNLSGKWYRFYDTGELWQEVNCANNSFQGLFTTYYKNGNKKSEKIYKDGVQVEGSLSTEYYENGMIKVECIVDRHYINDEKWGEMEVLGCDSIILYWETGFKSAEGKYLEEKKVGKWIYYSKDGIINKEEFFDDKGVLINTKEY